MDPLGRNAVPIADVTAPQPSSFANTSASSSSSSNLSWCITSSGHGTCIATKPSPEAKISKAPEPVSPVEASLSKLSKSSTDKKPVSGTEALSSNLSKSLQAKASTSTPAPTSDVAPSTSTPKTTPEVAPSTSTDPAEEEKKLKALVDGIPMANRLLMWYPDNVEKASYRKYVQLHFQIDGKRQRVPPMVSCERTGGFLKAMLVADIVLNGFWEDPTKIRTPAAEKLLTDAIAAVQII